MSKHGADSGSTDSSRDQVEDYKACGCETAVGQQNLEDLPVGKNHGAGDAVKRRSLKDQQRPRDGCHGSVDGEDVSVADYPQVETSREKEDMSTKSQTDGTCLTEVDVEVQTMPSAEVEVVHSVDEKVVAWRMRYVEENVGEGRQRDTSKTGNEKVKSDNISRNLEKGEKFFRKKRKSGKVRKDTGSLS